MPAQLIEITKEKLLTEPVNGLSKRYLIKIKVEAPYFGPFGKPYYWQTAILYETHCPEPNKKWFGWVGTGNYAHLDEVLEIYEIKD